MDFNKLNSELYQLSAPYKFSKQPTDFDKGYMKISNWLNDLCYYYEKKRQTEELHNENEFKAVIKKHKDKIEELGPSEYKDGLLKALQNIKS